MLLLPLVLLVQLGGGLYAAAQDDCTFTLDNGRQINLAGTGLDVDVVAPYASSAFALNLCRPINITFPNATRPSDSTFCPPGQTYNCYYHPSDSSYARTYATITSATANVTSNGFTLRYPGGDGGNAVRYNLICGATADPYPTVDDYVPYEYVFTWTTPLACEALWPLNMTNTCFFNSTPLGARYDLRPLTGIYAVPNGFYAQLEEYLVVCNTMETVRPCGTASAVCELGGATATSLATFPFNLTAVDDPLNPPAGSAAPVGTTLIMTYTTVELNVAIFFLCDVAMGSGSPVYLSEDDYNMYFTWRSLYSCDQVTVFTASATQSATKSSTASATPSASPSVTASATPTPTATQTPTTTATATPTPSQTPAPAATSSLEVGAVVAISVTTTAVVTVLAVVAAFYFYTSRFKLVLVPADDVTETGRLVASNGTSYNALN